MKKVLFILDASNPINRILRRAVIVGVMSFISVLITYGVDLVPAIYIPILTAIGVAIDKGLSEYLRTNE